MCLSRGEIVNDLHPMSMFNRFIEWRLKNSASAINIIYNPRFKSNVVEKPQTFRFKNIHLYYWTELPPEIVTPLSHNSRVPSRPQQKLLQPDLNPTIISTVVIGSWHLLASTKQILWLMVYTKKSHHYTGQWQEQKGTILPLPYQIT